LAGVRDGALPGVRVRPRTRRGRVSELRGDHRRLRSGRGVPV